MVVPIFQEEFEEEKKEIEEISEDFPQLTGYIRGGKTMRCQICLTEKCQLEQMVTPFDCDHHFSKECFTK